MNSVCRRRSGASPPVPLRMEKGVITEIPLYVLKMFSGPSSISSRLIGITSHTTPLAIRRGAGGEASVFSVCRRPSVSSKLCAKMLSELCVLCERKTFTKYVSSPIGVTSHTTPLAIRRGAGGEAAVNSVCRRPSVGLKLCAKKLRELCVLCERKTFTKYVSSPIGVTSHITPLAIRRGAGGEASVISVREGTVLLFYHVTFLSPNNALHKTKKVTNLSHHRLFTCLITRCKDK